MPMVCKKCRFTLPEGARECPVCGKAVPASAGKRGEISAVSVARLSDLAIMLMFFINGIVLATLSHVSYESRWGLFYAWGNAHWLYPGLATVNVAFGLALIIIAVLSAIALYLIVAKESRLGVHIMTASHVASALWTLLYPVMCYMVTGKLSAFMGFACIQTAVYAVIATIFTVLLYKSRKLF